jgi:hypothetical protein
MQYYKNGEIINGNELQGSGHSLIEVLTIQAFAWRCLGKLRNPYQNSRYTSRNSDLALPLY